MRLRTMCIGFSVTGIFSVGAMYAVISSIAGHPELPSREDLYFKKPQVVDASGRSIAISLSDSLQAHGFVPLHEIPQSIQQAFIHAEDKRFFEHNGVDWIARASALAQNVLAGRGVRGASTISEQVVRIIHSRPRSLLARLVEGVEAGRLERSASKAEIFEFYLNQVPYARRRRGVALAADMYFDRDLQTLSAKEAAALAVLVRAPSRMDLRNNPEAVQAPIERLLLAMKSRGILSVDEANRILAEPLVVRDPEDPIAAAHFVRHVVQKYGSQQHNGVLRTTLDGDLQEKVQNILDSRVEDLRNFSVNDGAVLVVENDSGAVRAWVNAGGLGAEPGSYYDSVRVLRQPGSTLKPFLYAAALERGWTAAHSIEDAPLEQAVGTGLHGYRNYSGAFYGAVRLREALGNSLNSPAVRTIGFVGRAPFLDTLRHVGITSLTQSAEHYGDGLALGNAEVSLYELVQAYRTLANRGRATPLRVLSDGGAYLRSAMKEVVSFEVASIIGDILSDPEARRLEFGGGGVLHLPVQTAVKTGTSNDYRDAWSIGFSSQYTVGVWMGNLDRQPMNGISGSKGPASVLRSVFAELFRNDNTERLQLSAKLVSKEVCAKSGLLPQESCPRVSEWFRPQYQPVHICNGHVSAMEQAVEGSSDAVRVVLPTQGLRIAKDPRIPDENEKFPLEINEDAQVENVRWVLNGETLGNTSSHRYLWPITSGQHRVKALVKMQGSESLVTTPEVEFYVR